MMEIMSEIDYTHVCVFVVSEHLSGVNLQTDVISNTMTSLMVSI